MAAYPQLSAAARGSLAACRASILISTIGVAVVLFLTFHQSLFMRDSLFLALLISLPFVITSAVAYAVRSFLIPSIATLLFAAILTLWAVGQYASFDPINSPPMFTVAVAGFELFCAVAVLVPVLAGALTLSHFAELKKPRPRGVLAAAIDAAQPHDS